MQRTAAAITRVHDHCHRQRFDQQSAQENHRGYSEAVIRQTSVLQKAVDAQTQPPEPLSVAESEAISSLMVLIVRSERDLAPEQVRQQRFLDVIPLFGAYPPCQRLIGASL